MAEHFERIGQPVTNEIHITIEDAERLRAIARNVILSDASFKQIDESSMTASLMVSDSMRMPGLDDDNVPVQYAYVEDVTYGDDGWRSLLKYHSYKKCEGELLGFAAECAIDVFGDEILAARRSIYRFRDLKNIFVDEGEINVEISERRTMADTSLESAHVDKLEARIGSLVRRAERV